MLQIQSTNMKKIELKIYNKQKSQFNCSKKTYKINFKNKIKKLTIKNKVNYNKIAYNSNMRCQDKYFNKYSNYLIQSKILKKEKNYFNIFMENII